jgi:HlyD family secretion protein
MSVTTTSTSSAYKKAILRFGIGFLIVIVLLTFFSQTLNNIALAKVSVESPASNSLQKVITATGAFAPKQIVDVNLGVAGKVSEVLVSVGDVVKAGDPLVKMDLTDLNNQIATEQTNLTKMKNNKAKSQITTPPDYTSQTVNVNKAWSAYVKARDAYNALKAQYDAQKAATPTPSPDPSASPSPTATPITQAQLDAAKQAETDAYNNYKVAKAALDHQKAQDANSKKSSALDQKNSDLDIQTEENKIATLQQELADNAEIKATVDGRIQSVNAQAGQQAGTAQPLLTMLDTAHGLEFSFDVTNDNAEQMPVGTQMDIHLTGSTASVTGSIREIKNSTANPGVNMTVYLDADTQGVLDNSVQPNQKGDIRYNLYTNSYNMTLSNGAVREDSSGYFVLVVSQQKTPLGASLVAHRVDVELLDSDSYRSAVSGGVSQRDQVISSSDKSVSDGDTVRMAQ